MTLLYFFARQSHPSCLIPWPTDSKWQCFISLPGGLIDHISSHYKQRVSKAVVSLINHVSSHDQQYVSDTALFLCQEVSSMSQTVSDTASCLCQAFSSIGMSHPMTNREWVTLLYFFPGSLIPQPTGCKWHCFIIFLPGTLMNHVSFHHLQVVSDTVLFLCQALQSVMSHPLTNREWVTLLYFFARQS